MSATKLDPYEVRGFSFAVFLMGHNVRPVSAHLGTDGNPVFVFEREAAAPLAPEYREARDILTALGTNAKRR